MTVLLCHICSRGPGLRRQSEARESCTPTFAGGNRWPAGFAAPWGRERERGWHVCVTTARFSQTHKEKRITNDDTRLTRSAARADGLSLQKRISL